MPREGRRGNLEKRGFAETSGGRTSLTQKGRGFLRTLRFGRSKRVAKRFGLDIDAAEEYAGLFSDFVPRDLHYREGIDFQYHPSSYGFLLSFVEHAFPGGKLKGKKVLDIGYGHPAHLEYLASKGVEAHGIDQHFEYPDSSISENLIKDHFQNISKHFKPGSFDTIISKETFEERGVREVDGLKTARDIRSLLKPGGFFVMQVAEAPTMTEEHLKKAGFKVDYYSIPAGRQGFFNLIVAQK